MHYAYVDGRRVSNHLMRDCQTFLILQEVVGYKQAKVQNQRYKGTPGSIAYNAPPPLPSHGGATNQGQPNSGNQSNGGYIQYKGHIAVMI
jgi:hypothetical protein